MYSQRDEETFITRYWQDICNGRFLDVGAYDGKTFSNTRRLVEWGWSGVLVEPSPSILPALQKRYKNDPEHVIVPCGIGLERGTLKLYDFGGDAISSFDLDHAELWSVKGGRKYTEKTVEVITWGDLLDRVGEGFDFLNLDAEAWSVRLLEHLPWSRFLPRLKMICVEFDHMEKRVEDATVPRGFRLLHKSAENMIMVR